MLFYFSSFQQLQWERRKTALCIFESQKWQVWMFQNDAMPLIKVDVFYWQGIISQTKCIIVEKNITVQNKIFQPQMCCLQQKMVDQVVVEFILTFQELSQFLHVAIIIFTQHINEVFHSFFVT